MRPQAVNELNPLVWAFVGDAVFTLKVREVMASSGAGKTDVLHKKCSALISAPAQSRMLDGIAEALSPPEAEIVRRARNTKTATKAKNATSADYHKATALEALMGYLFLTGQTARLNEIQNLCLKVYVHES